MAFSIQTNINSLIAQENLRVTGEFQSRTIQRLTSGFRINQSGDDAAGLAIANKFRSDIAELSQGVRNANDGISTLQIVDGGMNNISKMIDRLKTLAAQSASGTFTGDRNVLNSEFQSVLSEIDRQAQAVGLNQGGQFAKSLSVFIGGGKTNTGAVDIANGSITINLTRSTVDASSLGLKGMQAASVAGTDLSASTATSVANILANTDNLNSQRTAGFSEFYFSGAGFSGAEKVRISINTSGVADTASAVEAINAAIESAAGQPTEAAQAFAAAGIKASVVTTDGKETIAFTSSSAAFQVEAGDKVANALLGNFEAGAEGKTVAQTITSVGVTAAAATTLTANQKIVVRIQGGGLAGPVDIALTGNAAGTTTVADTLTALKAAVDGNAALAAAGISLATPAATQKLAFTSATGETFEVMAAGDTANLLGLGSWALNDPALATFDAVTMEAAADATVANAQAYSLEISLAGGATQTISFTSAAAATIDSIRDQLNAAVAANDDLAAAGFEFTNVLDRLTLTSSNGTAFRVNETSGATNLGFGATGAASTASFASTTLDYNSTVNSGGANTTALGSNDDVFAFTAIRSGGDDQTISLTAVDANGAQHKVSVVLRNDATSRNGATLDAAINAINDALQQSSDATMKTMVAVKEVNAAGTAEGIRFMAPSTVDFQVSIGTNGSVVGIKDTVGGTAQGLTYAAEQAAGGSTIDISSQEAAQSAVSALTNAVTLLGSAQAAVGKAQNQLGYALGLAQSQAASFAAAESRIRDADIAAEAANLTKAQVLQQASMAAMAQANSAPQAVMALLRG